MIFQKLRSSFSPGSAIEFLVVGLGNPGQQYENTRHNAGFLAIDSIARQTGAPVTRLKFKSLCGEALLGGKRVLLLKPQTYMNNSGEAVSQAAAFYKIPPERVLVIFDDVSLDVGKMRIRRKGSDGGHNGIKSIIALLGSQDFPRIKIGVGKKPHPYYDLANWVLGKIPPSDRPALDEVLGHVTEAAELILSGKTDEAMNRFN